MFKNVAGQKWVVFAFDTTDGSAKTGDAANITGKISIDHAAAGAITDTNPTEIEDGYYVFDLTQGETNGDHLLILPESSTSNIQVIGVPGSVQTVPPYFSSLGIESDGDLSKVNALDGHTVQTGDSYSYLGTNLGALGANATEAGGDGDHLTEAGGDGDHLTEAGGDGDHLTEAGGTGDQLTALATAAKLLKYVQLLARSDAAIETDNATELTAINADGGSGGGDYSSQSESQEALRDRGDAAWVTGGGGSISDILNISALVPLSIDLANTATFRVGLMLVNSLDDLPSTAEIAPGTIDIDRKAIGATSWSSIVSGAACSELAGLIYYDEVFDTGTGYAEGDSIRITFKGQKITVAANDYEISDANGRIFYTSIRQTMRGTDSGATAAALSTHDGKLDTVDGIVDDILADTDELQGDDVPGLIGALNDPTAAAIRDAILDRILHGNHDTLGSPGWLMQNLQRLTAGRALGIDEARATVSAGVFDYSTSDFVYKDTGAIIADLDCGLDDFVVSFWVKLDDAPQDTSSYVSKWEWDSGEGSYHKGWYAGYIHSGDSTISIVLNDGSYTDHAYGPQALEQGLWYHIAHVIDRDGNATTYVNGVAGTPVDISGITLTIDNTGPFQIGASGEESISVIDVRLYKFGVDSLPSDVVEAVLEMYHGGPHHTPEGYSDYLTAYYLDGDEDWNDNSGNGNNLTTSGSPSFATYVPRGLVLDTLATVDTVVDAIKVITDALPDSGALTTIGTDTARLTAARAAVLTDLIDGGRLDLLIDAIKAVTDALPDSGALTTIGTDTARLTAARAGALTDWIDGGRLDLLLDAIKTVTDALTAAAAAKLALSAGQIVTGTVSHDNTAATTTVFYSDDITEATADHYNGRIVIFTSGALAGQATSISDYELSTGEGKFTVVALTEAPADNVTFIIV